MRAIISLKQIKQADLELFKNALNNYASTLQVLQEMLPNPRIYMKDLSITVELWYDFNGKTSRQHPAENSLLKLPLHKAIILMDALNELKSQKTTTDYERNRCNRYAMAIDQQLPTVTQIISQNLIA